MNDTARLAPNPSDVVAFEQTAQIAKGHMTQRLFETFKGGGKPSNLATLLKAVGSRPTRPNQPTFPIDKR